MGIKKIIWGIFCVLILASCGNKKKNFILKSEYDNLMSEYVDLKNENQTNQKRVMEQASVLEKTLQDLASISSRTTVLRQNVEIGKAKISQVDNIQSNILAIKSVIEEYEQTMTKNTVLQKTLVTLKKLVEEKEKEISELKTVIYNQDVTIKEQQTEISKQQMQITSQTNIISAKEQELQGAFNRQIELLYQAGLEFEKIANEDIDIKNSLFRNNKEKLKTYKTIILKKALQYYSFAANMGHAQAKLKVKQLEHLS